jgi:hypothetical protein
MVVPHIQCSGVTNVSTVLSLTLLLLDSSCKVTSKKHTQPIEISVPTRLPFQLENLLYAVSC